MIEQNFSKLRDILSKKYVLYKGLYILETEYCHLRAVDEGEYKYIDSIIPIRKKQIIIQENQYLKLIEKTEN